MTSMSTAAAAAGRVITMALSAVTWVSLLVTLGTTIYQFFKTEEAAEDLGAELDRVGDKVKALNEEFKHFNEIQTIMTKGSTGFVQFFQAAGIRISQLSASMQRTIGELSLIHI